MAQESNDAMLAFQSLRSAYKTDVSPILAKVRQEKGGAINMISTYRTSKYREHKSRERKVLGLGAGIV